MEGLEAISKVASKKHENSKQPEYDWSHSHLSVNTKSKEREKWIKLVYLKFLVIIIQNNGAKKKDLDGPRKFEGALTVLHIIRTKWSGNII